MTTKGLEEILSNIYEASNQLEKILGGVNDNAIQQITGKPLQECGISDKVKLAEMYLELRRGIERDDFPFTWRSL